MKNTLFCKDSDQPLIHKLLQDLQLSLSSSAIDQLMEYVALVAQWNQKMNLVSAHSKETLIEILLADAIVLSNFSFVPKKSCVIDVGSGAGAPAIPLRILRDDLRFVLIESKQKKVAFLNLAVGQLNFNLSLTVRNERVDPDVCGVDDPSFDVAISRATFAPETWIKIGSRISHRTLLLSSRRRPPKPPVHLNLCESYDYQLPYSKAQRKLTIYDRKL